MTTTPADAKRLEAIRADYDRLADANEPVHILVSDIKALLRIVDRQQVAIDSQNAVVEAARKLVDMAIDPAIPELLCDPLDALDTMSKTAPD